MVAISCYKLKKVVRHFATDVEASKTAFLLKINRNTINKYYNLFRRLIFESQVKELRKFTGEVELDESYFGPRRVKGRATRRGRGTHRQPVFGIYERNGRVYTEIIPDCATRTLRAVIRGKIDLRSTVYSDSWSGYSGLVDVGFDKHFRINHKKDEFSNRRGIHINGIEAFWSFTKRRLAKFNGVKMNFNVHLKECEWRWNKSTSALENDLLMLLRANHLV